MPTHRITVHPSQPLRVDNTDLIIEVYADDKKYGELRISREPSTGHPDTTSTPSGWNGRSSTT